MDKPSLKSIQTEANRLADTARDRASETLEEVKVASNQLVDQVRDLIEQGNVRRVTIKRDDRVLFEVPLTVGVGAGAAALLFTPVLAALGAVAALVTDVTLVVEREGDAENGSEQASDKGAAASTEASSGSGGSKEASGSGSTSASDASKTVGRPGGESGGGSASGAA